MSQHCIRWFVYIIYIIQQNLKNGKQNSNQKFHKIGSTAGRERRLQTNLASATVLKLENPLQGCL